MLKLITLMRPYAGYLLAAWVITIVTVSSTPNINVPRLHTGRTSIRLDYLIHFLEYGLLAGLTCLTFTGKNFTTGIRKTATITVVLIIFAILDEFHQKLIPGRSFNPRDIYSNIAGIITGVVISVWLFRMVVSKTNFPVDR